MADKKRLYPLCMNDGVACRDCEQRRDTRSVGRSGILLVVETEGEVLQVTPRPDI